MKDTTMDRQSLQQYCEALFTKGEHPGEIVANGVTYREIVPHGLFGWCKATETWYPCKNDRLWQLAALEAIDRHWLTPAPASVSIEQPKAFIDETGRRWVRGYFPGTIELDDVLWRAGPDGWHHWSCISNKWMPITISSFQPYLRAAMAALWP